MSDVKIEIHEKWVAPRDLFLKTGGILMVIGDVDTGKSTFCRWMCGELLKEGKKVALVDCDVGQSDIGPPACITMAVIEQPIPDDSAQIKPDAIHFVGSTSPMGHLVQGMIGTIKMLEKSRLMGAANVIVNTTGWIDGPGAVFYKISKIDAVRPRILVALERNRELNPIIRPYKRMEIPGAFLIPVSPLVKSREREERRQRREKNFEIYFAESVLIALKLDWTGVSGISFPVTPEKVNNQVVALMDRGGEHLALGIITNFDVKSHTFEIKTPFGNNPRKIKRLHFENFFL